MSTEDMDSKISYHLYNYYQRKKCQVTSIIINHLDPDKKAKIASTVIPFPGYDNPGKPVLVESTPSAPIEIISNEPSPEITSKSPTGPKRSQTESSRYPLRSKRACNAKEIEGELATSASIETPESQDPIVLILSDQPEIGSSTNDVPNETSTSCKDERAKLTLQPLSPTDTLYKALSVALGEKIIVTIEQKPKADPFCWQCHKRIKVQNDQVQGLGCEFCQISFCQLCLTANKKPRSRLTIKDKNTNENSKPKAPIRAKFPRELRKMEPDCERLISQKWQKLLANKKVCFNCVDRVAEAVFNRTCGFMTSDYERKVNNLVFCDVVGVLMGKAKRENKDEIVCYNSLIKVSQNGQPNDDVVVPMTLKMIEDKANNSEYRSTKDFVFDINLILHNLRIENGVSIIGKEKILEIHDWLRRELQYVDMCATCYRNFYVTPDQLTNDNGFEVPCSNPHSIVWAKYLGMFWFPAKVFECRPPGSLLVKKKVVNVLFFGQSHIFYDELPKMKIKDLYLYSNKIPPQVHKLTDRLQKKFENAQKLVKEFLRLLNIFYDNQYVVPEEPKSLTDANLYILDIGQYHEERVRELGFFTHKFENSDDSEL